MAASMPLGSTVSSLTTSYSPLAENLAQNRTSDALSHASAPGWLAVHAFGGAGGKALAICCVPPPSSQFASLCGVEPSRKATVVPSGAVTRMLRLYRQSAQTGGTAGEAASA